jgi:hypothetical protein
MASWKPPGLPTTVLSGAAAALAILHGCAKLGGARVKGCAVA